MSELHFEVAAARKRTAVTTSDSDSADAVLAAAGDAHAFERLYRGHVTRIFNLARRMMGPEEADEITQDVFVRAWEKLGTFRGDAAFGTWLHRVGINVILGRRQKLGLARSRYTEDDEPIGRMAASRQHAEFYVDFDSAIERLPPGAREVFVLHDVEGFKHHEIADLLGVSAGTSKAQLHRARQALRRYLD
jgi:RNA polymerase sigma-70 factor, ECF subfamily